MRAKDREMNATEICLKVAQLVGEDRNKTHGDVFAAHSKVVSLWNAYLAERLRQPLVVVDVSLMLALLKIARTQVGVHNIDDYIDLAGHAGCAGYVVEQQERCVQNDQNSR